MSEEPPSGVAFSEALKTEYDREFEVKERLDNKASNMITFSGATAAIFMGFGTFLLKDISTPNPILMGFSVLALLIGLGFIIKTIIHAINASRIVEYSSVMIHSTFLDDDGKPKRDIIKAYRNAPTRVFSGRLAKDYLGANYDNAKENAKKAVSLKEAQFAFRNAVVTIPIFAVFAIATKFIL